MIEGKQKNRTRPKPRTQLRKKQSAQSSHQVINQQVNQGVAVSSDLTGCKKLSFKTVFILKSFHTVISFLNVLFNLKIFCDLINIRMLKTSNYLVQTITFFLISSSVPMRLYLGFHSNVSCVFFMQKALEIMGPQCLH